MATAKKPVKATPRTPVKKSGGAAPAWTQKATKKAGAPRYTPRKSGGK
jgi:hypothetical protein